MRSFLPGRRWRDLLFCLVIALATALVLAIPSRFAPPGEGGQSEGTLARVERVDDSMIKVIGPLKHGEQQLTIRILTGRFAGRTFETTNNLVGKMEIDKYFAPGDRAFAVLDLAGDRVAYANVVDHFRLDVLLALALLFLAVLVLVGGWVGVRALLSFVFSGAVLFKVLLPAMLRGWDPVWTTLGVVAMITGATLFLVGGLTRRATTAFAGAMGGVLLTSLLSVAFTRALHIHGAVRPFTETLLYSGYGNLDLARLFMAGVFLASSGAVMDLAMDIAAAMEEVREHHPGIGRLELVRSGISVGRHVLGTMTTTLLLAYSSGYSAMLMTFIAQGVPVANILNMVYIAAEFANTLVGSFGLVLVAPFTALAGGIILAPSGEGSLARDSGPGLAPVSVRILPAPGPGPGR
jgi:uncharacterized membrane protein